MSEAVFLDKDGTIVEDLPYNVDPLKVRFCPGVEQGLRTLAEAGYKLVLVTNQPGISAGKFSERKLQGLREWFLRAFENFEVRLSGFYYCPHSDKGAGRQEKRGKGIGKGTDPKGSVPGCPGCPGFTGRIMWERNCRCRKPYPGLLLQAAKDLEIDLSRSWMVGDILDDVEAGRRAGCKTVLIDNGNETEWKMNSMRTPDFTVRNFSDAARVMLKR